MKRSLGFGMGLAGFFAVGIVGAMAVEETPYPAAPSTGSAEFEQIKTLVGRWKGTSTSQAHGDQPADVEYKLTSGGSALVETMFPGTPHEMVSIYHDRDGKLTMTHYCILKNQPELDLQKAGPSQLVFDLSPRSAIGAKEPHMHALTLTLQDSDHVTQEWTMYEGGAAKDKTTIQLSRS